MQESISYKKELREAIKETVSTMAMAVKSTLGPSGTNVGVMTELRLPLIINDGVTVAKQNMFKDPLKKYIANIIKTVSQNTDNIAGDGTTTSITLAEAIILESLKNIDAGFSQVDISKGIHVATVMVLEELEKNAISVIDNKEMLLQVASISANNDAELGKVISEAFLKVGVDGQIEVKDSDTEETYIDTVPGMKYNSGLESNMFTNNDKGEAVMNDCKILIYEGKLRSIDPIVELLKDIRNANDSLLIIADDYDRVCIDDLAANKVQSQLKVCAVKSPGYGIDKEGFLEDIALTTGAKIISKRFGTSIENWSNDMIGIAETARIDRESFIIVQPPVDQEALEDKVKALKLEAKKAKGTDKDSLLQRIAKLTNGIAVMYVAGNSPVEVAEKKYRIEDAINSTRASLEEGVVPGGGITLARIGDNLKMPKMDNRHQEIGFNVLLEALKAPLKTIAENSGTNGEVVLNNTLSSKDPHFGYDAKGRKYKNLVIGGVLDPVKVTKTALTNASSVSELLITMNFAIYE